MDFEGAILPKYFNKEEFSSKDQIHLYYHPELERYVVDINELRTIYSTNEDLFYKVRDELYLRDAKFALKKPSPIFPTYSEFKVLIKDTQADEQAFAKIDYLVYGIQSEMDRFHITSNRFYNGMNIEGFKIFGLNKEQLRSLTRQFMQLGFEMIDPNKKVEESTSEQVSVPSTSQSVENHPSEEVVVSHTAQRMLAILDNDIRLAYIPVDDLLMNLPNSPSYNVFYEYTGRLLKDLTGADWSKLLNNSTKVSIIYTLMQKLVDQVQLPPEVQLQIDNASKPMEQLAFGTDIQGLNQLIAKPLINKEWQQVASLNKKQFLASLAPLPQVKDNELNEVIKQLDLEIQPQSILMAHPEFTMNRWLGWMKDEAPVDDLLVLFFICRVIYILESEGYSLTRILDKDEVAIESQPMATEAKQSVEEAAEMTVELPSEPPVKELSPFEQTIKEMGDKWFNAYQFVPIYYLYDELRANDDFYHQLKQMNIHNDRLFSCLIEQIYGSDYQVSQQLLVAVDQPINPIEAYLKMYPDEKVYLFSNVAFQLAQWQVDEVGVQMLLAQMDQQDKIWLLNQEAFVLPETIQLEDETREAVQKLLAKVTSTNGNALLLKARARQLRRLPAVSEEVEWTDYLLAHVAQRDFDYYKVLVSPYDAMAGIIVSLEEKTLAQVLREEIHLDHDVSERDFMEYLTECHLFKMIGRSRSLPDWLKEQGEIYVRDKEVVARDFSE